MARAYVKVYCDTDDGTFCVRTFGGNKPDVRWVTRQYKTMTKEQFLKKHPWFADKCKINFNLEVWSPWSGAYK